jgi:polar amino acid transport system substrate-binding protein
MVDQRVRTLVIIVVICLLSVQAKADTLRISTAEFPEARSIIRVLKEAYGKIGHDVELVIRPAKRSLVEVNNGRSDAELARVTGAETEYPNLVRVKEPIHALSFSAIVSNKSKQWLSSWQKIKDHHISYPRGYRLLDIRTKGMKVSVAKDPDTVAKLIKAGRVDVGIVVTSDAIRFASGSDEIALLEPPIEVVTLYHYVNVKHRRLVPKIEKILIELNDSGRIKQILQGEK